MKWVYKGGNDMMHYSNTAGTQEKGGTFQEVGQDNRAEIWVGSWEEEEI